MHAHAHVHVLDLVWICGHDQNHWSLTNERGRNNLMGTEPDEDIEENDSDMFIPSCSSMIA